MSLQKRSRIIEVENSLILIDTIQTLCEGISQQQTLFGNDQLVSPLLPNVDNPVNPVVPNVVNPEPITLYHFASKRLRARKIFSPNESLHTSFANRTETGIRCCSRGECTRKGIQRGVFPSFLSLLPIYFFASIPCKDELLLRHLRTGMEEKRSC